jgi:hypothetical protein
MGQGGIGPDIELHHGEVFGGAIDQIGVAARSHWHRHAAIDAGQQDVGEETRRQKTKTQMISSRETTKAS